MRRAIVPAALVAALAVAGCGGGSGGSSSTRSTATTGGTSTGTGMATSTGGTATGTSTGATGGTSAVAAAGKQIFTTVGCSSCHTLADAGARGQVGPNLDGLKPSEAAVLRQVTNGGGGMPAFKGQLSSRQIQQVAAYVSSVAGK